MHPTIGHELAQARIADLRRDAQRESLARAARRARPHQSSHPGPALPALARHVLAVLPSRNP